MKKIKSILPALSAVFVLTTVSCSGNRTWNKMSKDTKEINYALYIGQLDHNDSHARTYGTRSAFGTNGERGKATGKDKIKYANEENAHTPIVNNEFTFPASAFDLTDEKQAKFYAEHKDDKFIVTEKEHAEQRATGGATWDQITANENTSMWISKHSSDQWVDRNNAKHTGLSLNFLASNNDGMAMGALGSKWFPTENGGLPVFGYDANSDALEAIMNGTLTGTVECNVAAQCASVLMLIRNVLHGYTGDDIFKYGFTPYVEGKPQTPVAGPYGYINGQMNREPENASFMSANFTITRPGNGGTKSIADYVEKDEKTGKYHAISSSKRFDKQERATIKLNEQVEGGLKDIDKRGIKIYQTYYSNTDNFLLGSVKPLFEHLADKDIFNIEKQYIFMGNGNDDDASINDLRTQVSGGAATYDAYIINMVKNASAQKYLDELYVANGKEMVEQPVIFFNRIPAEDEGQEIKNVMIRNMADGHFKFIYYVGMDAIQGGIAQGEMMVNYLAQEYYRSWTGAK